MTQHLFLGTGGYSVWHSDDHGETFRRLWSDSGLYSESRVYAMASHPENSREILVGTDSGLYRLDTTTLKFAHQPSPMDEFTSIWSIAYAPDDPSIVLAGTRPAGLFRSSDGGRNWERADAVLPSSCPYVLIPRVTKIDFSPIDSRMVWASLEIGGVWRSVDGGKRWMPASTGLISDDVHDVTCMPGSSTHLFAATHNALHRSLDGGANWAPCKVDIPVPYFRTVVPRADGSGILFVGTGNGPPGSNGRLLRSRDFGLTWEQGDAAGLPPDAESTLYSIAVNPADPNLIFAASALGQFYRSQDGGESWRVLPFRLSEIRSLFWLECPWQVQPGEHPSAAATLREPTSI
jgi:photosystem II stability/assembly factor-like uncharacterized protein